MLLKLFIVIMSFFSFVYSDSKISSTAPMTIEAVDTSDKTTIFLNNKTAWSCEYKDLFNGPYGWHLDDNMHIVYVYLEGYYLQNVSSQGCVPVKLLNGESSALKVTSIKEIISSERKSTNTIVLDNGSKWFIGSWSSSWMKNWQPGDRVIATPQEFIFGHADYLLLNLDKGKKNSPENVRAQLIHSSEILKHEDLNKRANRNWNTSITCVWEEHESIMIELTNKTLWKCSLPSTDWQTGDAVQFALDLDKKYEIINLRNSERINATLINCHSKEIVLPAIKEISKNGGRIVLNDLSVWFTKRDGFKKWHNGDRLLVSSLDHLAYDTSSHLLINIDEENEHRSATLVK